jgi:rubrerythrin
MTRLIETPLELYAHAIAIEREAAQRYSELAERMADEGRDELARVFGMLAGLEAGHLDALERRTSGLPLPAIAAAQYQWLDAGAPETAAHELVFRLLTPHQALAIALQGEKRAAAFFERVFVAAGDPALRALAREMAAEEHEHVGLIERLLERNAEDSLGSTLIFHR